MSTKTWSRDTSGLTAHAKRRSEEKRKRVDEAITRLLQRLAEKLSEVID